MKATSQHEIHPDAESLNAFAEQALGERERSEMLRHLAVCVRCRQVVTLAREATEAEIAAEPIGRPAAKARRGWWKEWRLVLAPVAALAATAVVAIYFHQRHMERSAEMAQATPPMMQSEAPPANPAVQLVQPAAAQPQASPAAAAPEKKELKPESSGNTAQQESPEMAMLREMPPRASDRAEAAQVQSAPPPPAAAPTGDEALKAKERQEGKNQVELEKQQSETGAETKASFAAKANAPPSQGGDGGSAQASSEQVQVTAAAPELETRTLRGTSFGALGGSAAGGLFARPRMSAIHLPSRLPVASFTTVGSRMLAIDKAGALYLSEDSGSTWQRVAQRWTGRAVAVRRQASEKANADKESEAGKAGKPSAAVDGAPLEGAVFEIVNDKSQVWLSIDGKTWTAK